MGGRFSGLSLVGLLPAACAGIDIQGLLNGASAMDKRIQDVEPLDDPAFEVTRKLAVAYKLIPEKMIKDRMALTVPSFSYPGSGKAKVELINLSTERGHVLLFLRSEMDGSLRLTERVCSLEADSRLVCVQKIFRKSNRNPQIWVVFNQKETLHLLKLQRLSGRILEQEVVSKEDIAKDPAVIKAYLGERYVEEHGEGLG